MSRKDQKLRLMLAVHNAKQALFNAISAEGYAGAYQSAPLSVVFMIDSTRFEVTNEMSALFLFEHGLRRYYSGRYDPMSYMVTKKITGRARSYRKEAQYMYDARLMRRR
jgi:hypothetical protein